MWLPSVLLFALGNYGKYRVSSAANAKWKKWRKGELEKDMQFCHPRWPEERKVYIAGKLMR